ncbi:MAG: hypothetical protein Q9222_002702 [Ikaeria aurantiellina]
MVAGAVDKAEQTSVATSIASNTTVKKRASTPADDYEFDGGCVAHDESDAPSRSKKAKTTDDEQEVGEGESDENGD